MGARAAVTTTSAESESRQKCNVTCRQGIDRDIVKKELPQGVGSVTGVGEEIDMEGAAAQTQPASPPSVAASAKEVPGPSRKRKIAFFEARDKNRRQTIG